MSQNLCFFQDFSGERKHIDVYNCKEERFFASKDIVSMENESFVATLEVTKKCAETYVRVVTSPMND